ncbi:hypothetical protein CesoFtcFv8_008685 [Champsocephalus esox]|uniref:ribonuclease H n=1 Tax=Champsocephalus esox TaxID=159716 RepID=A0AAN8H263_9TELE|nr:hypothetical protein CesoFtcFv8_008685 [Champsocephalus esox]
MLTDSAWVFKTVTRGYRLQFAVTPPHFSGILYSQARGESAHILEQEIFSLLEKKAISIIPAEQSHSGFYSKYFLVPKRESILDLRALNKYLKRYKFRMLTHTSLLRLVSQNDWFTSVDLKDAYFHIPVYYLHRKYLWFAFYEYRVLPFGMSLSPQVFIRCMEAAIAPLRQQGIRLASYLDDWLLLAQSEQEAIRQTNVIVKHLLDLGFVINTEKSMLSPAQTVLFLGLRLNSVPFTARLSAESESLQGLPRSFPATQICSLQVMSAVARAHGVSHSGSTTGTLTHKGVSALGSCPQIGPRASWRAESDGHYEMRNGTAPLATPDFSSTGRAYGCCPIAEGGHHRRISDGLGGYIRMSTCERSEQRPPTVTHK